MTTSKDAKIVESPSGIEIPSVVGPLEGDTLGESNGSPGEFPFTRGIDPSWYRDQTWVMGQYSGYSSPRETNARIKNLVASGQRGFSIALDLPTQVGLDSDDPRARGEVGRVGVPIDTLADMEQLLDGIPMENIDQIRTTANAIGPIAVALFIAATEKQGIKPESFRLLLQNDSLKEYVARGTYIFPPPAGLKFSVDVIEYCAKEVPHWEPIEFCGYHIRDSGSTAIQEVAIAVANAQGYLDEARSRGINMEKIAPHMFMFLSAGMDIFEEVAKFRAARRFWARMMHEKYGIPHEQCGLRIFSYTLGSALTAAEPKNNVVRVAYEALSAALGGVQTLATSSFDEAFGLPSDEAVNMSLRTQQILAHETGVRWTADPLGGSYYVEWLTTQIEDGIVDYLGQIEKEGGCLAILESGWLESELTTSSYRKQQEIESGKRTIVGVNYLKRETDASSESVRAFSLRVEAEAEQVRDLQSVRARRNSDDVEEALRRLRLAAEKNENTIPSLLVAVRAYASIGEMCGVLKGVWGEAGPRSWRV